jgi:dihydrofolate reductase
VSDERTNTQLTVTTFVSVDGVYQGPGGPDEDRGDGFDRGGWLVPHFDEATGKFIDEVFGRVDAFLLGRRTYDIFAASWPNATDPDDTVANRLNTLPKYVASTILKDPQWANTTVLEGDLASAVRELKKREGPGAGRVPDHALRCDGLRVSAHRAPRVRNGRGDLRSAVRSRESPGRRRGRS